jgi:hypothetical protein
VGLSSLGGGVNEISIHFNFPPAGFGWTTRTRVTATGGDGSITFDQEMDSFPGAYYPGGQPGDARGDFPSDTDTSGGMTIDTTMIDPNGNTVDAEGMIYPPDPVTNTC